MDNQKYPEKDWHYEIGDQQKLDVSRFFQEGSNYTSPYSVGSEHYCMIDSGKNILCGGLNDQGQLGLQDPSLISTSVDYSTFGAPSSLSSGHSHTCSISSRSLVVCWGSNEFGQSSGWVLPGLSVPPVMINLGNRPVVSLSSGFGHTCALTIGGEIWCWGAFITSSIIDEIFFFPEPTIVSSSIENRFVSISSGPNHVCASTDKRDTYCWGSNEFGQIDISDNSSFFSAPREVMTGKRVSALAMGERFSCFLEIDTSLHCLGEVPIHSDEIDFLENNTIGPVIISSNNSSFCTIDYQSHVHCTGESIEIPSEVSSISLGSTIFCFVRVNNSTLECNLSNYATVTTDSIGTLINFDSDFDDDGFPNHVDDFPLNSELYRFCNTGTFSNGNGGCKSTQSGHFTSSGNMIAETPCEPGYFQPNPGQEHCLEAEPGNFVEGGGSAQQSPCPPGTFSPESGASDPSVCTPVQPGNYSLAGSSEPLPCLPGTYQPEPGQVDCIIPPDGAFVPDIGSSEYLICKNGTYRNSVELWFGDRCLLSPPGYFSGSGASLPSPCPSGTYSEDWQSESIDACNKTPPGFYTENSGERMPIPCPTGTFQPNAGMSSCILSPKDHFVPGTGSVEPTHCSSDGITLTNGAKSSIACIHDQDSDGIIDREDNYPLLSGNGIFDSVFISIIFSNFIAIVVILENRLRGLGYGKYGIEN